MTGSISNTAHGRTKVLLRRPYVAMPAPHRLVIARCGPWERWTTPLIVGVGIAVGVYVLCAFGGYLADWSAPSRVTLAAVLAAAGVAIAAGYTLSYAQLIRDRHDMVIRRWLFVWQIRRRVPLEWIERVKILESSRTGEGTTSTGRTIYHKVVLIEKNQAAHKLISGLRFRRALDAHRAIEAFLREQIPDWTGVA